MDFINAIKIAASGLTAQRLRMNVVSSNLANANTTSTENGGPYRRKDAVFTTEKIPGSFDSALNGAMNEAGVKVKVAGVTEDSSLGKLVYDPEHPDANKEGYVEMPNVNVVEEMVNMLTATRSYEANLTSISALKQMANEALKIST